MYFMGLLLSLRALSAHEGKGDMRALEKGIIYVGITTSIPFPWEVLWKGKVCIFFFFPYF